jgi:hypothetical protein
MSLALLHHFILKNIIQHGHAPSTNKLSILLQRSEEEVLASLRDLQEYHGVVLHPNDSSKIWVIHPFSMAPTNFTVKLDEAIWYGNCAWCSLGCAAILQKDCTITTSSGGHGERIDVHIVNGEIIQKNLFVHFPIPMKNAWDNVIYTCSTMLLFHGKDEIAAWSSRHNIPMGDIQPIEKIWVFAQEWYGNHLSDDWVKWTAAEAQQLFLKHGLTHEVWDLQLGVNNDCKGKAVDCCSTRF